MVVALLLACRKDEVPPAPPGGAPSPLLGVEEVASFAVPGLHGPAYVIRTQGSIPYVYAEDREDLARVSGFVVARDRFFVMDLERRLAQGRLSELLGDAGLSADQEARGTGMTRVTDALLARFDADPEWGPIMDAYAAGIDLYVERVHAGYELVPSEYQQLGPILGRADPADMVEPWDRRDLAGVAATLIYNLGFETTDVGRAEAWDLAPGLFVGAPNEELRRAGVLEDILPAVEPVWPVSSAPGWGPGARGVARASGTGRSLAVPAASLERLRSRMSRFERWFGHDRESGFGSNAWAVGGYASADGRSYLAGDGHLGLSIPPLFYDIGLDTAHLGGGDVHQVGMVLPGFPTLAVGTNGQVAWSQTQLFGDITDWYRDELVLDGEGLPTAARSRGQDVPLVRVDESYTVADVPLLGSVGRTETWPRWETADGRLLAEIEGVPADADTTPGPGQSLVNVQGAFVIPQDIDGDGVVTGVSFDYTAFDDGNLVLASDGFGRAANVAEFREATKRLVAYSQNMIASDAAGDILYTGYQAVPCRDYLPRNPDGSFVDGADPTRLVDGTQYGGFTIPVAADGTVDESDAADPYRCVVPFEQYPQSVSPAQGYVLTANNDVGNISTDGSLWDDPYYIGGPWLEGYRAKRIDEVLAQRVADGTADLAAMSELQGDHHSTLAEQFLPTLLEVFDAGRAAAAGTPAAGSSEARVAALWTANRSRLEEVEARLLAWRASGLSAESGVETFYDPVEPGELDVAVATTLWNVWFGEYVSAVFDDEGFPSVWYPSGDTGRLRTLTKMLATRGDPAGMASTDPATGECVFFDVLSTPEVEGSVELELSSLVVALDRLTGPSTGPGTGGFGTADMDQWLWGYRHLGKFESILTELFDEGEDFGLIGLFSVTPDDLPLMPGLSPTDPRASLPWFPRRGDHLDVDAGNTGFAKDEWMYGSGPVFRMVVALGPDGAEIVNILPGGQSGIATSPYRDDQAALWLANETWPLHTTVDAVIGGASGRETYTPE